MTTRAEEIAAEGPYTVRYDNGRYVLDGPTPTVGFWALEEWDAQNHADDLNAAYKQGQQDRWIPVSERLPELHDLHQPDAFGQSEEVLVSFINQESEREQMVDVLQRGGQGDTTTVRWCNAYGVTHWMPLPPTPPNP